MTTSNPRPPIQHIILFHVVMEHATITFTDRDDLQQFMGDVKAADLSNYVVCESEVTGEEYNRVSAWRGEVS